MTTTKTGFDFEFERLMQDPDWAAGYRRSRARLDQIEGLLRSIDEERTRQRMSKAELARRIQAEPSVIRRLFSNDTVNPTLGRIAEIAHELGMELKLTSSTRS